MTTEYSENTEQDEAREVPFHPLKRKLLDNLKGDKLRRAVSILLRGIVDDRYLQNVIAGKHRCAERKGAVVLEKVKEFLASHNILC